MKDSVGFSDSVSIEITNNDKAKLKSKNLIKEQDFLKMSIHDIKKKFKDQGLDITQVLSALALVFKNIGDDDAKG